MKKKMKPVPAKDSSIMCSSIQILSFSGIYPKQVMTGLQFYRTRDTITFLSGFGSIKSLTGTVTVTVKVNYGIVPKKR